MKLNLYCEFETNLHKFCKVSMNRVLTAQRFLQNKNSKKHNLFCNWCLCLFIEEGKGIFVNT